MRFLIFLLFISSVSFAQTWEATIVDQNQKPIDGIVISTTDTTFVSIDGSFSISNLSNSDSISFTGLGYEPTMIGYQAQQMPDRVVLQDAYYGLEQIIVSSVKLEKEAPFSFSEIKRATIKKINLGQDVPMLLQRAPSVVAHSDAGNGIGYTYLRIRGSDQTRINVTVNNIPINDSESHQVFWVNMPDIASSSSSIQIQRGVGNSNNGAGAFGASVNIQTTNTSRDPYVDLAVSGGSFGAQKYTLSASSGLLNDKFVLEGRGSYLQSDGYVDRASAELQSYYLSASYLSENSVLKLVHFGGDERTFQSWYGVPEAKLNGSLADLQNHYQTNLGSIYRSQADSLNLFNSDRRYNFYEYENQVDDYGQDHYQAHFSNQSGDLSFRTALHYTRGGGFL
jgi:Outer membrane cobalamin receptor protein